jgi:hypothetical protein
VENHDVTVSSDGGGIGALGGFLFMGIIYWFGVALALPVGLGLIADALLVVWTVGLVGGSAVFAGLLFAIYARRAASTRSWLWMFDLLAAPIVAMWLGWLVREPLRGYWVDATAASNANSGSQFLWGAFMFVFFLCCVPLSVWGLGRGGDRGIEGTIQRVLIGYLPMFFAVGSWTALVMNSTNPVLTDPPNPLELQTTCEAKVRDAAKAKFAEVNRTKSDGKHWMDVGQVVAGEPEGWTWRSDKATVHVAAGVQWWRSDQAAPVQETPFPWTCGARWDPGAETWLVEEVAEGNGP